MTKFEAVGVLEKASHPPSEKGVTTRLRYLRKRALGSVKTETASCLARTKWSGRTPSRWRSIQSGNASDAIQKNWPRLSRIATRISPGLIKARVTPASVQRDWLQYH